MQRIAMVWAGLAVAGCPLEPGQTRCTTNYGVTNCQSYVAPPPVQQLGWWCTSLGDIGVCTRTPGNCEVMRAQANKGHTGPLFAACLFQAAAICATSGCFTSPEWCAKYERQAGRSAAACAVVR